jgi:hypothetical protein
MEENQKDQAAKPGENGHEIENDSIVPDEILERIPQKERKEFYSNDNQSCRCIFSPESTDQKNHARSYQPASPKCR